MRLVFVYGSLKKGFYNNHILADSRLFNEKGLTADRFHLIDLGRFPGLSREFMEHEESMQHIRGEVYLISKEMMEKLDRFEGVPRLYRRRRIKVRLGGDRIFTCYAYTIQKDRVHEFNHVGPVWEQTQPQ